MYVYTHSLSSSILKVMRFKKSVLEGKFIAHRFHQESQQGVMYCQPLLI